MHLALFVVPKVMVGSHLSSATGRLGAWSRQKGAAHQTSRCASEVLGSGFSMWSKGKVPSSITISSTPDAHTSTCTHTPDLQHYQMRFNADHACLKGALPRGCTSYPHTPPAHHEVHEKRAQLIAARKDLTLPQGDGNSTTHGTMQVRAVQMRRQ